MPPIAEPMQLTLLGPLDRDDHCSLNEILVQGAGGAGDHEATVPILDQAAPALSRVRF